MKHFTLSQMTAGWFVGDFEPTAQSTDKFEVAVKHYKKGDKEPSHHHKIGTEITVIISGSVRMNNKEWQAGDIILLEPGESTDFEALSDVINVVVKSPSVKGDKFIDPHPASLDQ